MGFRKGQAALDFLMTYGWAIALMVIIAAVLFALGVFDVSNFVGSKAAGFSGVSVTGWKLGDTGVLQMKVANQVGQRINVYNINATIAGVSAINDTEYKLGPGEVSSDITFEDFGDPTLNSGYTASVVIKYTDMNSLYNYTTAGTLTGRVSS